ncbi:hypothetical protein GA380_01885 [Bacteroides xylanisolvens]|jgi:hypothetical protein|uniref:Uncharacterized protein n=13 Tax=Bacteroidales TaxID=171549 RepID=A0A412E051_BACSE|nr:hypothetical protein BACCOP_01561 [Phocaeicola coprocola DSM 17136]EEZ23929.1 hypothetical protein HMPREF0101_04525 [Bacteroides fragilis]KAA3792165.1 hypothetical protein F3F97_20575 [Bacteroides ovatus]KAA5403757.1 hypothetical protein F2Y86_23200 [Bacteroides cellulosilyticus]KAB3551037.1 hypothetical protein GAX95_17030 [Phocaeicola vulgatus]KAB4086694.1 hypothetical protein GAQ56_21550 [Bacteroides uniformis]KAB4450737.1 hypothetical protein GAN75_24925 [Bacteroides thetaiotaomicron]
MTYGLLFYVEVASLLLDRGVMIYFKTGLDKREIVCICSKSIVTISIEFQPVGFFCMYFMQIHLERKS